MDPDANYREQQELWGSKDASDKERVRELVAALREWLQSGGFKPRGYVGPKWRPRKLNPREKRLAKLQSFAAWASFARWTLAMEKEFGREPNNWPAWGLAHLRHHVAVSARGSWPHGARVVQGHMSPEGEPAAERVQRTVERDMRAWLDVTRGEVRDRLVLEGVEPERAWNLAAAVLGRAKENARSGR